MTVRQDLEADRPDLRLRGCVENGLDIVGAAELGELGGIGNPAWGGLSGWEMLGRSGGAPELLLAAAEGFQFSRGVGRCGRDGFQPQLLLARGLGNQVPFRGGEQHGFAGVLLRQREFDVVGDDHGAAATAGLPNCLGHDQLAGTAGSRRRRSPTCSVRCWLF